MQIEKLTLHGFGKFTSSTEFQFLPRGINLILGDNESGKSTLIAAIFAAFYGLKPAEKKRWQSWEQKQAFRVAICFNTGEEKEFLLERDFMDDVVLLKKTSGHEEIIYHDFHRPTPKFNRLYFEALSKVVPLPPREVLLSSTVVLEHQMQIDNSREFRQILTGGEEKDYEQVIARLEEAYYRITREALPGKKGGGPRLDRLLEQKKAYREELTRQIEAARAYLGRQKVVIENLERDRKKLRELENRSARVERQIKVVRQIRDIVLKLIPLQQRREELQKNLKKVRELKEQKERLELILRHEYERFFRRNPTDLEKEISVFVVLHRRLREYERKKADLATEIAAAKKRLAVYPGFAQAPTDLADRLIRLLEVNDQMVNMQEKRMQTEVVFQGLRKQNVFWVVLSLLMGIGLGVALWQISAWPVLKPWMKIAVGVAGALPVGLLIYRLIGRLWELKKLSRVRQLLHLHLQELQEKKEQLQSLVEPFVIGNLEKTLQRFREYEELRLKLGPVMASLQSVEEEIRKIQSDKQYRNLKPRYEEWYRQLGDRLLELLQTYRKYYDEWAACQQKLSALPDEEQLLTEEEELENTIRVLELERNQLLRETDDRQLEEMDGEQLSQRLEQLEAEQNRLQDQRRQLDHEISLNRLHLESKDLSDYNLEQLTEERERVTEEIERLEIRKAALRVALENLQNAIERFRRENRGQIQSAVQKNWESIIGKHDFKVELLDNFDLAVLYKSLPVKLEQLSSGARDQLYLSYRLAMTELIARGVSFPLIFDDAFVHCDLPRRRRIMRMLKKIASRRQVFVLSSDAFFEKFSDQTTHLA